MFIDWTYDETCQTPSYYNKYFYSVIWCYGAVFFELIDEISLITKLIDEKSTITILIDEESPING